MHQILVRGLKVDVVRKDIKNLHLGVYPPEGRVRVAAPLRVNDEAIRLAVISKLPWIKRQQNRFLSQERQSEREYVYRENHYFFGQRYLLNVIEHAGQSRVEIQNKTRIDLYVPPGSDALKREQVLLAWYRRELKALIPPLITKWKGIIGVTVEDWGVRKMKTKWGSCNINARRIWLNLELAKKPVECLEYVVVHEMVHLLERNHNDRYKQLMDQFMPQWRQNRDILNQSPLSHEAWTY
ncbi:MAG TPA: M48 family metallopeptidase [Methanolinea sp.]|nr:M48 family metallopeptidase [Methanolinea sp.]